jgi:uncharacterized protein
VTTFNLRALKLRPGEAFREDVPLEVEALELGGERYAPIVPGPTAALRITRTTSGLVLELSFETALAGPCVRCLEDATVALPIRAREYHEPGAASEELQSPYVRDGRLDLSSWARDALALELPEQILCREECAGLCGGCGANLNAESCSCPPAEPDPRLAVLAALRDRLG